MKNLKIFLLVIAAGLTLSTAAFAQHDEHHEKPSKNQGKEVDGGMLYGADINSDLQVISFNDFVSNISAYEGKEVVIKGNVSEVCQEMGCWMILSDGSNTIRVDTGHKFFVPKNSAGGEAVVQGKFAVREMPEDEAKHYMEESGKENTGEIKGPQKTYEITATGIKFLTK